MVYKSQKIEVGLYLPNFKSNHNPLIDELEAYRIIQTENIDSTIHIQEKFKKELSADWEGYDKSEYKKLKEQSFQSVTFSLSSPRFRNTKNIRHTNLINLDLDEEDKQTLDAFREKIRNNEVDFARACALSVSGVHSGAFWMNVKCEITQANYADNKELFDLLQLSSGSDEKKVIDRLHKEYNNFLQSELSKYGISFHRRSYTQPRFLSNDSNCYVNINARVITLDELLHFVKSNEKRKRNIERKQVATKQVAPIGDWIGMCEYFANEKQDHKEGNRMFCFRFGFKANRLGIKQEQVIAYLEKALESVWCEEYKEQALSAYSTYEDQNEKDKKLLHKIDSIQINLKEDERVSDKSEEIDKLLQKHKKIELIADCGIGKNYAFINHISKLYYERTGQKTVMVLSLNLKVYGDAKEYNVPYLTSESLKQGESIWEEIDNSHLVLCNQNQFARLAYYLTGRNEKCLTVIDEVQTLTKAYRQSTSKKLLSAIDSVQDEICVMTGTPKPYFHSLGFTRVKVNSYKDTTTVIVRQFDKNWIHSLGDLVEDYNPKETIILAKYDSIPKLYTAKDFLLKSKGLKDEEVVIIHSGQSKDERANFEDRLYSDKRNSFAENVRVVLCTSAMNEGISIHSTREIIPVVFNRTGFFEIDDFLQFLDRDRKRGNSKNPITKKAFCYFPHIDHAPRGFNSFMPAYQFEEQLSLYNDLCKVMNKQFNQNPCYSERAITSLQNTFSDEQKLIYYDVIEKSYKPDVIGLMVLTEKQWMNRCTCNEGFEHIVNNYNHIEVKFDNLSHEIDEVESEMLEALEENEKLTRAKAKEVYLDLYQKDKELLFQAILRACDSLGIEKLASHSKQAKELTERFPELFDKYLSIGKQIVQREQKLKYYLLNDEECENVLVNDSNSFLSEQRFNAFLEGKKMHLLLMLLDIARDYPESKLITQQQAKEACRLEKYINSYPLEEYLTQSEIVAMTKEKYKRNSKNFKLTKQNAMMLLNTFFQVDSQRFGANGVRMYAAIKPKSFSDFLREGGLENNAEIVKRLEDKFCLFK